MLQQPGRHTLTEIDSPVKLEVLESVREEAQGHPHVIEAKIGVANNCLITRIKVPLPQRDEDSGVSSSGVKSEEDVCWSFSDRYPFEAPFAVLRSDFPRNFPHINPNKTDVIPCIIEGSMKELLQQPKGFLGLIDQMVVWLRKAAMDDLMDFEQGWVPMRNDEWGGYYHLEESKISGELWNLSGVKVVKIFSADVLVALPPINAKYSRYIPNSIQTLGDVKTFCREALDLKTYADLAEALKTLPCNRKSEGSVLIGVRRPCNIIGTASNIEWLPFAIEIEKGGNKRHVVDRSKARLLSICEIPSPELMKRLSGCSHAGINRIVQVGCGSLGSKIALHLARNGHKRFYFVDNAYFKAHNNARHALLARSPEPKADLMRRAVERLGAEASSIYDFSQMAHSLSENDIVIDSTASMAFRNELSFGAFQCRIIHTALYNKGRFGVFLVEGSKRNPRVDDLFAHIMRLAVLDGKCGINFSSVDQETVVMGQACSSVTTVMEDALISLHAAGMGMKVQDCISIGFEDEGIAGFSVEDDCSVRWNWERLDKTYLPLNERLDGFNVRILSDAIADMKCYAQQCAPHETGGFIAGIVNRNTMTITVVKCLPPTQDSVSSPTHFRLGQKGAKLHAQKIESESGGVLTYLGTWHSHPRGGTASSMDKSTYGKLFERRNFPTICLIWKCNRASVECIP